MLRCIPSHHHHYVSSWLLPPLEHGFWHYLVQASSQLKFHLSALMKYIVSFWPGIVRLSFSGLILRSCYLCKGWSSSTKQANEEAGWVETLKLAHPVPWGDGKYWNPFFDSPKRHDLTAVNEADTMSIGIKHPQAVKGKCIQVCARLCINILTVSFRNINSVHLQPHCFTCTPFFMTRVVIKSREQPISAFFFS